MKNINLFFFFLFMLISCKCEITKNVLTIDDRTEDIRKQIAVDNNIPIDDIIYFGSDIIIHTSLQKVNLTALKTAHDLSVLQIEGPAFKISDIFLSDKPIVLRIYKTHGENFDFSPLCNNTSLTYLLLRNISYEDIETMPVMHSISVVSLELNKDTQLTLSFLAKIFPNIRAILLCNISLGDLENKYSHSMAEALLPFPKLKNISFKGRTDENTISILYNENINKLSFQDSVVDLSAAVFQKITYIKSLTFVKSEIKNTRFFFNEEINNCDYLLIIDSVLIEQDKPDIDVKYFWGNAKDFFVTYLK